MKDLFIPNHLQFICIGKCINPPKTVLELNEWLISLVNKVDMKILSGPSSVIVDDEPGNEGITGTVVLSTSHACIHFWDLENPPYFQFDIYSCKEYSTDTIIEHLKIFDLIELEYIRIDRNNKITLTDQNKIIF